MSGEAGERKAESAERSVSSQRTLRRNARAVPRPHTTRPIVRVGGELERTFHLSATAGLRQPIVIDRATTRDPHGLSDLTEREQAVVDRIRGGR